MTSRCDASILECSGRWWPPSTPPATPARARYSMHSESPPAAPPSPPPVHAPPPVARPTVSMAAIVVDDEDEDEMKVAAIHNERGYRNIRRALWRPSG